ncbi:MAG: CPBP family glutamic-type intramembrane protease [Mongoliitalea sp.]
MSKFIANFYFFLTSGEISNQFATSNKKNFLYAFSLKWVVYLFFGFTQLIIFKSGASEMSKALSGSDHFKVFLNVVLLAPIFEELVLRYHLGFKLKNIILSMLASIVLFHKTLYMLVAFLPYFFLLIILIKQNFKVHRLILIYTSSLIFATLHLCFHETTPSFENSIFIFFPRFFSGLLFCFIYFNNGIIASIIFHMIWNLFPFSINFLTKQILGF